MEALRASVAAAKKQRPVAAPVDDPVEEASQQPASGA